MACYTHTISATGFGIIEVSYEELAQMHLIPGCSVTVCELAAAVERLTNLSLQDLLRDLCASTTETVDVY
jgi:hypothetical protein